MARAIIQIQGQSHALPIDHFPYHIGRASDNDLILNDPSVCPHHLDIIEQDGQLQLQPKDCTNPVKLNKKPLTAPQALPESGGTLRIGHIQLQLHTADTPLEPTRPIGCNGPLSCLLNTWAGAIALASITIVYSIYLIFIQRLSPWESDQLAVPVITLIIGLVGTVLLTMGLLRFIAGRWEPRLALSSYSFLFLLSTLVLVPLGHVADYFLTADWPSQLIDWSYRLIILPLSILYIGHKLLHLSKARNLATAISISLLTVTVAFSESQFTLLEDDDYAKADYNRTLLPWDLRLEDSIKISSFIDQAQALAPKPNEQP